MLVSCRKCGASASDKAEACPKCGAGAEAMLGMAKPCPECAKTVREGFPSCPACGLPAASFGAFHKFPNAMSPTPPGPSPPPASPPLQQAGAAQAQKQSPVQKEGSGASGLVAVIAVVALVGAIIWGMSQVNRPATTPAIEPVVEAAAEPAAPPADPAAEPAPAADAAVAGQAELDLLNDPASGAFFREFKSLFPGDYAELLVPILNGSSFLTTPVQEQLLDRAFDFESRNAIALLSADSYSLADLADRSADAMSTPRVCQMVASGDFSGMEYVDPNAQQALLEQELALIRAISSGLNYGSPRGEPTVDQQTEMERLMSERLTNAEMDAVMDGSVEDMALEQQCPIMSAVWDMVAGMPTDASAFWTAHLFRAGLESPVRR